ncbi:uncharacterized protein [Brachyistius frenatus]|uniref:uncharacterized protein n=1 Tax=Brachyistius frenatus TaxID=100188 RepID=UPI0037E91000
MAPVHYSRAEYYNKYSRAEYYNKYSRAEYYNKYSRAEYYNKYSRAEYYNKYSRAEYYNKYSRAEYYNKYSTPKYYNKYSRAVYYKYSTAKSYNKYSETKYYNKYSRAVYYKYSTAKSYNKYSRAEYYNKYSRAEYYNNTTKSTTEPLLKDPCTTPFNIGERETTMLMCLDCVLEEIKLEISNVITVLFASSPFYHYVNKVSKIVGSTLCAAVEILSLILVCAGDSCKVTLIALVCVVIVINSIELVIVSLSIGSSHELKGISDFAVKVCFIIHEIFTSAFLQRVLGY